MSGSRGESDDRLGAQPDPRGGFHYRVWAPKAERVSVTYMGPPERRFRLERAEPGYFVGQDPRARAGDRYWIALGRRRFPDPASRYQPEGITGPSALVDTAQLDDLEVLKRPFDLAHEVLYEMHVGAFSTDGTFDGARAHLDSLVRTGVTALELLPIEEERGERGWGYGPVHQFAIRRSYGGPEGLRRLVSSAHRLGLGVILDVVYNHWSGQAGFLERFGPYFHARAETPWGPTPNVDGPGGDEVRRYFFENARMWLEEYAIDGFRLDAVHEVYDRSAKPFWSEFSERCRALEARTGRRAVLIAESDLNDIRILNPPSEGGWGLEAQWLDDFHHALHAALTGERGGYYSDYGSLDSLARAFERPFLYEGGYSTFRNRRHGAPAAGARPSQFVVYDQNHDQIGNRGDGARLTTLLPGGLARVALGLTLLSPYVPMLFMGEEYGETRPFYFFADPPTRYAVGLVAGRLRQLRSNGFEAPPPDPTDPLTLARSRLDWARSESPEGEAWRAFVAELLRLRREIRALATAGSIQARAWETERLLAVRREAGGDSVVVLANLSEQAVDSSRVEWPGPWKLLLSSEAVAPAGSMSGDGPAWALSTGPGSRPVPARSLVVLQRSA